MEHANCTIVDMARNMFHVHKLNKEFWAKVMMQFTYVIHVQQKPCPRLYPK